MDEGHRQAEARRIVSEALDLEAEERSGFIEAACGEESELREAVRSMLDSSGDAVDHFEALVEQLSIRELVPRPLAAESSDLPAEIGPYRIDGLLGEGGMGRVYLAHDPTRAFPQQVAIKVLRRTSSDSDIARRFVLEREIIDSLVHENIARSLGGGLTEAGDPFIVLEFVDGIPIDQYCEREDVDVDDILRMALDVASALDWAHRHLVVHRDVKPGNVLVSKDGKVKLLDFGIAKILAERGVQSSDTAPGDSPRTTRYASPEVLSKEAVSVGTDVFGLGVVLYELLTKTHPFDQNEGAESLVIAICRGAPRAASRVAPRERRKRLAGDIDLILHRALQSRPRERYESMADFAADIRAHLDDRPISVVPPSPAYRLRKLYKRRTALVWSSALSVVLLIVVVIGVALHVNALTNYNREITAERNRANELREKAEKEADAANKVGEFLVELFRAASPGRADRNTVTARELLDEGARAISRDSRTRPSTRARLMDAMGEAYFALGQFDEARQLGTSALRLWKDVDPAGEQVGSAYASIARAENRLGDYDAALAMAQAAVLHFEEHPPAHSAMSARALVWAGWSSFKLGRLGQAQDFFTRSHELLAEQPVDRDCSISSSLTGLAVIHWREGQMKQSIERYEEVLEVCSETWGDQHSSYGHTLHNLSIAYERQSDYRRAKQLQEKVLSLRERQLPESHPDVAESKSNLASTLLALKEYEKAERLARSALVTRRAVLGRDHDHTAQTTYNLGEALRGLGRYEEARSLFVEAASVFESKFGSDHEFMSYPLIGLARLAASSGRMGQARGYFDRALRIRTERFGPDHPETLAALAESKKLAGP
ncbi:MAG: serine/threonine-protein kinase [Myxococcota bacterium]